MRLLRIIVLCVCVATLSTRSLSQVVDLGLKKYKTSVESPYRLDLKKDIAVGVGSGLLIGGSYLVKSFRTPLDTFELMYPDTSKIPSIDIGAIHEFDSRYVNASNVLLYTSMALPFLSFIDKRVSGHAPQIIAMYFETLAVNFAIQSMTTSIANRRRPYTFNTDSIYNAEGVLLPEVPFDKKLSKGAQNSFFSGHTSTASAATFFGAKVFTDFRPHSKLVPFVWGVAAAVPAFVAFSRYKAGQHFPTDVITGYAMGAAVGFLVPQLHKIKNDRLSLSTNYDCTGFALSYTF